MSTQLLYKPTSLTFLMQVEATLEVFNYIKELLEVMKK